MSTDNQEDNTSFETQEEDGRKYAQENGLIVCNVYREVYSGAFYRERKLLGEMRERYRTGVIAGVIIRTFDRLSRNQVHMSVLIDEMQYNGATLYCVREKYDDSAMGQYMRNTMTLFAQIEREKIEERTQAGRRRRVEKEGKIMPGRCPLFGYRWNDPRPGHKEKLVVHEEEAKIVRRIYRMYLKEGHSMRKIAKILNEENLGKTFLSRTIYTILSHPYYAGIGLAYRSHESKKSGERKK